MRILSLSFVAAALALAFTPALHAQDNTSRVRQAYLRAQSRQQEVRRIENIKAKADQWIAQKAAQKKREAWVSAHAEPVRQAPSWSADAEPVRAVRAARMADPAMNQVGDDSTPMTRPMVRRQRWIAQQEQAATGQPAERPMRRAAVANREASPQRQLQRNPSEASVEAPRRTAVRPAGGRAMGAGDQPSTRSPSRAASRSGARSAGSSNPQGGRGR